MALEIISSLKLFLSDTNIVIQPILLMSNVAKQIGYVNH